MGHTPDQLFTELCHRLRANVVTGQPDLAADIMRVPARSYQDEAQFQRELQAFFLNKPLLVALTCDVPNAGDYVTHTIVDHPLLIVRGEDDRVRTFLNICRHRGAKVAAQACGHTRRFVCPYHSWTYAPDGKLVGAPDADFFADADIGGLIELPCATQAGAVFACLDRSADLDLDAWLGPELIASLEALRLADMHPYRTLSELASPNWKLAADGYLDGYHIGYLHKDTIGRKSITNRNTYDTWGPHCRIGFATKRIDEFDQVNAAARHWPDHLSLVHYIFPNVSISGGHGDTIQLSRLLPGPAVHQSTTVQHQYFRQPVEGDMLAAAEEKRLIYEQVVRDEDCATIFAISDALPAMSASPVVFGRNEPANQNMHRYIERMLNGDNETAGVG